MSTKGDKDLFFEQVDLLCGDIDDPLEQAKIIQAFVGMPEKERTLFVKQVGNLCRGFGDPLERAHIIQALAGMPNNDRKQFVKLVNMLCKDLLHCEENGDVLTRVRLIEALRTVPKKYRKEFIENVCKLCNGVFGSFIYSGRELVVEACADLLEREKRVGTKFFQQVGRLGFGSQVQIGWSSGEVLARTICAWADLPKEKRTELFIDQVCKYSVNNAAHTVKDSDKTFSSDIQNPYYQNHLGRAGFIKAFSCVSEETRTDRFIEKVWLLCRRVINEGDRAEIISVLGNFVPERIMTDGFLGS